MKNTKKILALLLTVVMAISLAGCKPPTQDYDVSGYIRAVLDCCYQGDTEGYLAFTDATETQAQDVRNATVSNAAVRFCQKYSMNADEEQMAEIEDIMAKAFACSDYTVYKKTEAKYGYDVKVEYKVQTTLQDISYEIQAIVDEAYNNGKRTDLGADHIDEIITECRAALENPTYGETLEINFDILVDKDYYLSLNVDLYEQIDESILVF